jgi:hypothetical protein
MPHLELKWLIVFVLGCLHLDVDVSNHLRTAIYNEED